MTSLIRHNFYSVYNKTLFYFVYVREATAFVFEIRNLTKVIKVRSVAREEGYRVLRRVQLGFVDAVGRRGVCCCSYLKLHNTKSHGNNLYVTEANFHGVMQCVLCGHCGIRCVLLPVMKAFVAT